MDAVTDTATNEMYSPDDFSQFCVCVCLSTPSREGVFLVVQSDWQHVRKGGAGSGKETAQLLQSTTDTGIDTHTQPHTCTEPIWVNKNAQNLHEHAIRPCIYFIYHLSAFKQITQTNLHWFFFQSMNHINYNTHTTCTHFHVLFLKRFHANAMS